MGNNTTSSVRAEARHMADDSLSLYSGDSDDPATSVQVRLGTDGHVHVRIGGRKARCASARVTLEDLANALATLCDGRSESAVLTADQVEPSPAESSEDESLFACGTLVGDEWHLWAGPAPKELMLALRGGFRLTSTP